MTMIFIIISLMPVLRVPVAVEPTKSVGGKVNIENQQGLFGYRLITVSGSPSAPPWVPTDTR